MNNTEEHKYSYDFIYNFNGLSDLVLDNAKKHGWDTLQHEGISISLIHAELSECLEAYRNGNGPSEHIPEFSGAEEELADVIIRIMDFSAARKLKTAEAVLAKIKYNSTRPYKHGGKKY